MRDFVYTAWLQDSSLPRDAQDFEFPACFRIMAPNEQAALEWGDHLARDLCGRRLEMKLLRSHAELADLGNPGVAALPAIGHGHLANDHEIGW
jgi:hypothetical protein